MFQENISKMFQITAGEGLSKKRWPGKDALVRIDLLQRLRTIVFSFPFSEFLMNEVSNMQIKITCLINVIPDCNSYTLV